ncbi:MAG: endolytic transglycosylase MltG [Patescibacteria group bacterium]
MKDTRYPGSLMPKPRNAKRQTSKRSGAGLRIAIPILVIALAMGVGLFSLPLALKVDLQVAQVTEPQLKTFPVTVDPSRKTITEDPQVEALLKLPPTRLPAAVGTVDTLFRLIALKVSQLPAYQQLAGAAGIHSLFVNISPGERQEQVAQSFGSELGWTAKQRAQFVAEAKSLEPDLPDGSTVPGIYFASVSDPADVAAIVHDRFSQEILSRYGTTTSDQVSLEDAVTIASLLQRESGGWDDMRLISGVIWNRQFKGMKLQIDATLQYAEATQSKGAGGWWPSVEPKDKYIKSLYNTYQNAGLPPGPIANPSVAAILAALNPKKTDCIFYFHDKNGNFHCTKTYAEHVALLKKYYGQGK